MAPPSTIATRLIPPDSNGIAEAAALLRAGRLVAFPTETVYGLGADARSGEAVAALYAAKGRPSFNPLIAHLVDRASARRQGLFDAAAERLAEAFWPGPLTLVVRVAAVCSVSALARAGLGSVALRVPDHPLARALVEAVGAPVVAPSANRSGRVSPTSVQHVLGELSGRIDAVVDGGSTRVGLESTIVSCLGETRLLRPGGVTMEAIEAVLGRRLADADGSAIVAPGMLASHYAPGARVRLDAETVDPDEAVLDFGGRLRGQETRAYLDLSPRRDLGAAASNLFDMLRRLDGSAGTIAVAPIPHAGLGRAINDRLRRAAAPRPAG